VAVAPRTTWRPSGAGTTIPRRRPLPTAYADSAAEPIPPPMPHGIFPGNTLTGTVEGDCVSTSHPDLTICLAVTRLPNSPK